MRNFSRFALGLLAATSAAFAHEGHEHDEAQAPVADDKPSDVHVMTKDTFKDFVTQHPLVLAEFYAPWCGHCKALAPEYEVAATQLKEKDIQLVKVDCTEESELCTSYGVEGYPTVKVFRGPENPVPYGGARKADAIVSYMTKQSLPAVSILEASTIEAFKTADKVVAIAYFAADDKSSNETYTKVADANRDNFLFGATNDAALATADGVTPPAIVIYKGFDEHKNPYTGKFEVEEFTKFIKTAAVPLVGEVGPETYAGYMEAGIPLAYLFADTPESKESFIEILKPLAIKFKGIINIATIDAVAYGAHAGNLNLEQKWPAFAIQKTDNNQKFPFPQDKELTKEALTQFVEDFQAGKIEPSIKSEPTPESQPGPTYTIVAHNWEEIVMDKEKDVLVEFYAPWCGHCKALAPKWDDLGALYFNNEEYKNKVAIAKVDATANDVPVEIQGFPTIKLYPAGRKDSPVDYSGQRNVEDFAKFIATEGDHKIDAWVPPPPEAEDAEMSEAAGTAGEVPPAATETPVEEDSHDEL